MSRDVFGSVLFGLPACLLHRQAQASPPPGRSAQSAVSYSVSCLLDLTIAVIPWGLTVSSRAKCGDLHLHPMEIATSPGLPGSSQWHNPIPVLICQTLATRRVLQIKIAISNKSKRSSVPLRAAIQGETAQLAHFGKKSHCDILDRNVLPF